MRTTLDIDDDVLMAAKELARRKHTTTGALISQLARRALTLPQDECQIEEKYGFRPFASRGGMVTNDDIDRLRNEAGI